MNFNTYPVRLAGKPFEILNIAHRGARAYAPENTLPAFEKAKTFGCQMFEIDVHMTRDRELVVHHDNHLLRCTNAEKLFPERSRYDLSDFTYEELSRLDAGSWYVEQLRLPAHQRQTFLSELTDEELERFISPEDIAFYGSGEIRIPTLKHTLELAQRLDIMVNIELKTSPAMYQLLAEAVVALVESMNLETRVLVSSFDHEQLVKVRCLNGIIATAVLSSDRLENVGDYLNLLDADAYHPSCDADYDLIGIGSLNETAESKGILSVRQTGRAVNVWTCNEKPKMHTMIKAGVTGLISDFPNRVQDVLTEISQNNDVFMND